jgi:hypothetical protein
VTSRRAFITGLGATAVATPLVAAAPKLPQSFLIRADEIIR